jgi:hypothetical protein
MKVLVACEESQTITAKYRAKGIEAWSCDLKPAKINSDWHFQKDVFEVIYNSGIKFDLMIAHPPCTRLTVRSQYWNVKKNLQKEKEYAIEFFMKFVNCDIIPHIAIENPIGIMSSIFRKPDQIIQPYYFGDTERKATCLWLKNLPKLIHSENNNLFENKTHVKPNYYYSSTGFKMTFNDKISGKNRTEIRSKTFEGIANAIVEQWNF